MPKTFRVGFGLWHMYSELYHTHRASLNKHQFKMRTSTFFTYSTLTKYKHSHWYIYSQLYHPDRASLWIHQSKMRTKHSLHNLNELPSTGPRKMHIIEKTEHPIHINPKTEHLIHHTNEHVFITKLILTLITQSYNRPETGKKLI